LLFYGNDLEGGIKAGYLYTQTPWFASSCSIGMMKLVSVGVRSMWHDLVMYRSPATRKINKLATLAGGFVFSVAAPLPQDSRVHNVETSFKSRVHDQPALCHRVTIKA
jgi:hypothetical protein